MMNENIKKLNDWIDNPLTEPDLKNELIDLQNDYNKDSSDKVVMDEINDRFYKDMEFGTGGLRGKIGAGTNRMNVHTVRRVSQAFAEHLHEKSHEPSVVIAYDNRKFSDVFAFESACVFAANGIKVWLFEKLTPTPMLSYAVRELRADGGVVVTASHNSKEYNGYKIYDGDGCQCLPPEAKKVSDIMDNIDIFENIKSCSSDFTGDFAARLKRSATENRFIEFVPDRVNDSFLSKVMSVKAFSGSTNGVDIVYTPLNGTGNIPVTTILEKTVKGNIYKVTTQEGPDPEFTTCPKPNPEEEEALAEGLKLCHKLEEEGRGPDILMATDPDCDRIGIMVKDDKAYKKLDGNQVGILMFDYIVNRLADKDLMPEKPVMITTIVSTPMVDEIAAKSRVHVDRVLTGFKFIGDRIKKYEENGEQDRFIFGFEESCGYLAETFVRDKDAVSAALLIADMTGYYKSRGLTMIDRMDELYKEFGYFVSVQKDIEKTGPKGAEEIKQIMEKLRSPDTLTKFKEGVIQFMDYEAQTKRTMGLFDGEEGGCSMAVGTRPISGLPKENVLEFRFRNRDKVIIRPSGTEPKIKIYFTSTADTSKKVGEKMKELQEDFMGVLGKISF